MVKKDKPIVLKETGAIGDLVIASAVLVSLEKAGFKTGIISKGFTLPLVKGIFSEEIGLYTDEKDVPTDSFIIDISDYLKEFPHTRMLPSEYSGAEGRLAHLCEWKAYALFQKSGIKVHASRDDVRIILEEDELAEGLEKVYKISAENGHKPVVMLAPYSTTINRNMSRSTLEKVVEGISDFSIPCLLSPHLPERYISGTIPLGDENLRKAAAILYAVDACVVSDSGPLHIVNGVIQGEGLKEKLIINKRTDKVIAVLGSSSPAVVTYKGNRIIQSRNACPIIPCGAHGYFPIEGYSDEFQVKFYRTGNEKDKSGCIFPDYSESASSRCMESMSAKEIVDKIKEVIIKN
jgi:hypothetical protein